MSDKQKTAQDFIEQAFKDAKTAVKERRTAENLFIWGGQFSNNASSDGEEAVPLVEFLKAWDSDNSPAFKWMMAEEVGKFYVKPASLPDLMAQHNLLERVRLFGEAGDLDIRRDAATIHWRFISEIQTQLPTLPSWAGTAPFWAEAENQARSFARHEQCYYQWRRDAQEKRVSGNWVSDEDLAQKDVLLRQVHYLENGRVAFVRYVDFEEASA